MPLGGDGFSAPHAAYSIVGAAVTGDASAGAATIRVNMDPRFCSLVSYVTLTDSQASAADAEQRITISDVSASRVPRLAFQGDVTAVAATISAQSIANTWYPGPLILPGGSVGPFIAGIMTNVLADVYGMDTFIYLFDIRVRELTPMGPLLWARGAT